MFSKEEIQKVVRYQRERSGREITPGEAEKELTTGLDIIRDVLNERGIPLPRDDHDAILLLVLLNRMIDAVEPRLSGDPPAWLDRVVRLALEDHGLEP